MCVQVTLWLQQIGEVQLQAFEEHEDSLELLLKKQLNFKDFYTTAYVWHARTHARARAFLLSPPGPVFLTPPLPHVQSQCSRAEELLRSLDRWSDLPTARLQAYQLRVHHFWSRLQDFSQRVRTTGANIDRSVRLYRFLDQVSCSGLGSRLTVAMATIGEAL